MLCVAIGKSPELAVEFANLARAVNGALNRKQYVHNLLLGSISVFFLCVYMLDSNDDEIKNDAQESELERDLERLAKENAVLRHEIDTATSRLNEESN